MDQIFLYPGSSTLPLDVFQPMFNMNRPRDAIQTNTPPVPQLKSKDIGSGTDLQHHGILAGAMDRPCRDQHMIMLFHRNLIHIFFRRKCNLTFFRFSQIIRHLFTIHIFFQSQVNVGVLVSI